MEPFFYANPFLPYAELGRFLGDSAGTAMVMAEGLLPERYQEGVGRKAHLPSGIVPLLRDTTRDVTEFGQSAFPAQEAPYVKVT